MGEVARVASLVDRLRDADNADKAPLLEALESAPCQGALACSLKDLCTRAYSMHQRALDEMRSVRRALSKPGDAGARVGGQLEGAGVALEQARQLTRQCSDKQVQAVRQTLIR